jgi:hypothetical protein
MWAGIKKNWAENKWKYIGIGAAIVAGITALAILTAELFLDSFLLHSKSLQH